MAKSSHVLNVTQLKKISTFHLIRSIIFSLPPCQDENDLDASAEDLIIDKGQEKDGTTYGYLLFFYLFNEFILNKFLF